jgi:asparagine synthase (glutamine-hydrolysing)
MCGIIGFVSAEKYIEPLEFRSFTDSLAHRGPDHTACYTYQNLGLGHTRLKIIDLSEDSNQPMLSDCGRYVLIYNGEIYNYRELRDELIQLGFHFTTSGDTEVLLKSYQAWGRDAFRRFNGMWAFVIFDKADNKLIGCRDRFGIKPLYYAQDAKGFYFASEIRSLLKMGVSREANLHLTHDFLLTGMADHSQETFFNKIHCLKPGSLFEFNIRSNDFTSANYYDLDSEIHASTQDPHDFLEKFEFLLTDSVHLRMRADVEVGTCLSGGLDSSSVASLASRWLNQSDHSQRLTAFTAVSTDPRNDESSYANAVAQYHGMNKVHVKPSYEDFVEALPAIVKTQEEPFGGPSIVMQYLLMKAIRENNIKVLLDGQGGDELLLGYPRYCATTLLSVMKSQDPFAALSHGRDFIQNNQGQNVLSLLKYCIATHCPQARHKAYQRLMPFMSKQPGIPAFLNHYAAASKSVSRLQTLECLSTNLPALLRYEDKNSMAFGIEARLPFLDHRLLEYALSLPLDLKIKKGWSKWILRETMQKHLPKQIAWRKNKMAFEAPEASWLKAHASEMQGRVLESKMISQLTSESALKSSLPNLNRKALWRLYSVALWENEFKVTI